MSFVGNFLWFIIGLGFISGALWWLAGLVFCCTIIGIPIGIACFRIGCFAFFPFGRDLVDAEMINEKAVIGSTLVNIIWVIFAGFWIALVDIILGMAFCCTIIGIPFGIAYFKLAKVCFAPLGKRIVSSDVAVAARARYANAKLDAKFVDGEKK